MTKEKILDRIDLALRANGGREFRKDYCMCEPEVNFCPCEYCAIHIALKLAEQFINSTGD